MPDLLQEVLILALSSLSRYDPQRSRFERWLKGITVHAAAHYHDRAFRRRERVGLEEAPEPQDPALEAKRKGSGIYH